MPHEIFLTFFIVILWLLLIRLFFVTYNRVTFVSPKSGGYYHFDAASDDAAGPASTTSKLLNRMNKQESGISMSSSNGQNTSKGSCFQLNQDPQNTYCLLATAAERWKSEANLIRGEEEKHKCFMFHGAPYQEI